MLNRFLHRKFLVVIGALGLACVLLFLTVNATPQQVTSSVAIGTPGLTINSSTGRLQTNAGNNDLAGAITISTTSSASHTFSGTGYSTAPPVCVATPIADPTVSATPTWWVTTTTAAVTVHTHSVLGAGNSLTFNYVCIGNPN